MERKRKKFRWPKKMYDKVRVSEENRLLTKYGLKNKREIWKAEAKIKYFRARAKNLITASEEEQKNFFDNLNKVGLGVGNIADVLALNKEDLLKRRLQSIIMKKKIANTPKQARQMITHKIVKIRGGVVNVPSYLVKIEEEKFISLREKNRESKIKVQQNKGGA